MAVPLFPPLQLTSVEVILAVKAEEGWFIVTEAVPVQLFESVAVTVYVPEVKLLIVAVVFPFDHK